jgi:hypothetical protein
LEEYGRPFAGTFGEEGLKIDEAREIVDLLNNAPPADLPGTLLIGPMDYATRSASDVLLKSIEEFDSSTIRPVLWANDEADVSPTIRSRCLSQWCPGTEVYDEEVEAKADLLVLAALKRDRASVIEMVKDLDPETALSACSRALLRKGLDGQALVLWNSLREPLTHKNPSKNELLAALL